MRRRSTFRSTRSIAPCRSSKSSLAAGAAERPASPPPHAPSSQDHPTQRRAVRRARAGHRRWQAALGVAQGHGVPRRRRSTPSERWTGGARGTPPDHGRPPHPLHRRAGRDRGGRVSAEHESTNALPLVAIYADESCLGNGREGDNPGGAAGVIEHLNPATERLTRWDYWIAEPSTTNNRMALRSAIEAFRVIGRKGGRFRVLFTSDSQYLVKGMTEWVYGWASRGWRRKVGAIENLALWQELVVAATPHHAQWQWVRGHAGHPQNEYANDLAVQAAKEQSSSDGARTSRFDEWLEAQRLRKRVMVEPAPFPVGRPFAPMRPLPRASITSH